MYRIKEFNEAFLKSKGFIYDNKFSDNETIVLSRKSTVSKCIEVTIFVYSNNEVRLQINNLINKTPYSAWYVRQFGKNKVVEAIDAFIKKEFKKLGIRKYAS